MEGRASETYSLATEVVPRGSGWGGRGRSGVGRGRLHQSMRVGVITQTPVEGGCFLPFLFTREQLTARLRGFFFFGYSTF